MRTLPFVFASIILTFTDILNAFTFTSIEDDLRPIHAAPPTERARLEPPLMRHINEGTGLTDSNDKNGPIQPRQRDSRVSPTTHLSMMKPPLETEDTHHDHFPTARSREETQLKEVVDALARAEAASQGDTPTSDISLEDLVQGLSSTKFGDEVEKNLNHELQSFEGQIAPPHRETQQTKEEEMIEVSES